jgi:hypothetical protein
MSTSRWIVTLADTALFVAAVSMLLVGPVLCVLLVLPESRAIEIAVPALAVRATRARAIGRAVWP